VRAELDPARESLNKRIRNAARQKIPNVLVVGQRERAERSVTLRRYAGKDQLTLPFGDFQRRIGEAIATRSLHF
jgi:threonyl-tRNA synthetase